MKDLQINLHKIQNNNYFPELSPYLRFVRYLTLVSNSPYTPCIPLDSRLFYVSEGNGEIDVSGKIYQMSPGSCLYIPRGAGYQLKAPSLRITYLAVNFDFSQKSSHITVPIPPVSPENYSDDMLIPDIPYSIMPPFEKPLFIENIRETENTLIRIMHEFSERAEYFDTAAGNLLSYVLILLARKKNSQKNSYSLNTAEKIVNYINDNYGIKITNQSIADIFGFNSHYVSDMIKKFTGMSLHKYLLHVRMIKAISYMESNTYTLSEIAVRCGFGDIYYFSRYFKKEMGISPSEYMKNN